MTEAKSSRSIFSLPFFSIFGQLPLNAVLLRLIYNECTATE
jgi:hypothetical protein